MTTFLLIRHGETDAIGTVLAGSKAGWSLNVRGKEQARCLAKRLSVLPLRAVYTSPLERCLETAEIVAAPHALRPEIRERIGEFRFGAWEGMSFDRLQGDPEWHRFNTHRAVIRPPGGELMVETQARMMSEVADLQTKHRGETVAIVSHCDPLRSLIAYQMGLALDFILRFEISPASVTVIQHDTHGAQFLCINNTGDIPI